MNNKIHTHELETWAFLLKAEIARIEATVTNSQNLTSDLKNTLEKVEIEIRNRTTLERED